MKEKITRTWSLPKLLPLYPRKVPRPRYVLKVLRGDGRRDGPLRLPLRLSSLADVVPSTISPSNMSMHTMIHDA